MKSMLPSKNQIISGLVVFALGYFIVNKFPKVANALGNANKA